jgi:hypothetical protein
VIRRTEERCDAVDGLVYVCSLSGGSAGVADRLLERACVQNRKRTQAMLAVWPSNGMKSNVVQDYNCILSSMGMLENLNLNILV